MVAEGYIPTSGFNAGLRTPDLIVADSGPRVSPIAETRTPGLSSADSALPIQQSQL